MRTWCQVANIGFSLALLGLLVPLLTVGSAQKGRKKDIEAQKQNTLASSNETGASTGTGATTPAAAADKPATTDAAETFHKFSFDRFNSKVG